MYAHIAPFHHVANRDSLRRCERERCENEEAALLPHATLPSPCLYRCPPTGRGPERPCRPAAAGDSVAWLWGKIQPLPG